ncbi:MAG: hypothetical protein [Olavius algarvensis Gamma 1 endosymbiont]|nr:MAG: hypothetical protein [Olavius algarvensis Gamma 1 endosymbiont]
MGSLKKINNLFIKDIFHRYCLKRQSLSRKGVKDVRFFSHTKPQSHEERLCVSIENPRETVFSLRRRFLFILYPFVSRVPGFRIFCMYEPRMHTNQHES